MKKWHLRLLFNVIMLLDGVIINVHYWQTDQFSDIKQVSANVMTLVMIYIILHFTKRVLFTIINWWDWLYYLALVAIALPVLFANSLNENLYHWILDLGCIFFIIPVLIDSFDWWKNRKTTKK